jgi:CheY-like chemotaxis protein
MFDAEPDFEIRLARNGKEAVEENRSFQPDVITLDINMPEMDGLTALSLIMADRPVAVVMISSLTEKGALATFEALNLGAVDYVVKPGGTISLAIDTIRATVVSKVRIAANSAASRYTEQSGSTQPARGATTGRFDCPHWRHVQPGNWARGRGHHWRLYGGSPYAGTYIAPPARQLSVAGAGCATHAGQFYPILCTAHEQHLCDGGD